MADDVRHEREKDPNRADGSIGPRNGQTGQPGSALTFASVATILSVSSQF